MSQVKQICEKYNKKLNNPTVIELKGILSKHMGYFTKMSEWVFSGDSTLDEIKDIIDLLSIVKIHKPIHSFDGSEQLYDHICEVQNKRKLNQVIKSIPSISRRNVSQRIKDIIYNNIDKTELFKDFFSKKGGTCKTEDDLYQNISEIVNIAEGGTSYEDVLKRITKKLNSLKKRDVLINILMFIPRLLILNWISGDFSNLFNYTKHGEIVYKDGNTIIVKINTYVLSSSIGSRHWCISNKKKYWHSYCGVHKKTIQYFIYQTEFDNKESMIGVTVAQGDIKSYTYYKDDSACYDSDTYLLKYSKYLKGLDVEILSIHDVARYNITNLNTILSFDNWEGLFDMGVYSYGNYDDDPDFSTAYYRRSYDFMVGKRREYYNKLIKDIYNNVDLYDRLLVSKFIYRLIKEKGNIIGIVNYHIFADILRYDDPFIIDDKNFQALLTRMKIAKSIIENIEILRIYNNKKASTLKYKYYSHDYNGNLLYKDIKDPSIMVNELTYKANKMMYVYGKMKETIIPSIDASLDFELSDFNKELWNEWGMDKKMDYLNKIYNSFNLGSIYY